MGRTWWQVKVNVTDAPSGTHSDSQDTLAADLSLCTHECSLTLLMSTPVYVGESL